MCIAATRAWGFDDPSQFFVPKSVPHAASYGASAEGVYFTGAPRFVSQTCASCHTGAPGRVQLKLGADPPSLLSAGYQPGMTYLLEVELLHESEGLQYATPTCTEPPSSREQFQYVPCNNNGFALEVDAADGPLAGPSVFCAGAPMGGVCPAVNPQVDEAVVAPDGDAVFANRPHDATMTKLVTRNDPTRWHVWWTAPPAGSGPLTLYLAAVDGNGGAGTADDDQDAAGDDTVQASFSLQEAGAPVPTGASAGCTLAGRAAAAPASSLLLMAALLLLLRRLYKCAIAQIHRT